MKVYANGFVVKDINQHFGLQDFFAQTGDFYEFKYHKTSHVLFNGQRQGYFVGLLARTVEDHDEPFLQWVNGKPKFEFAKTTGPGERTRFLFFVINKKTQCGVLSRYHGSGTVFYFGGVLKSIYSQMRRGYIDLYKLETEEAEAEINEEYLKELREGTIEIEPYLQQESFTELVKNVVVFRELRYTEPFVRENSFRPIKDQIKHRSCDVKMVVENVNGKQSNPNRGLIRDFINGYLIAESGVDKATVVHEDANGVPQPNIELSPQVGSLADYEYSDVICAENANVTDIASSPFIAELIKVAKNHPGMFETKVVR